MVSGGTLTILHKSSGTIWQHMTFWSLQGNSHTGSTARQQELGCSIFVSAASLIKMQHMAQTAFRWLLPNSRTSCMRQRLAYLLLLIPVSPSTWQTTFWTVPLSSVCRQPSSHFCKEAELSSSLLNSIIHTLPSFLTDAFKFCRTLL